METFSARFLEKSELNFDESQKWNWTPQGNILAMAMTPNTTLCGCTHGGRGEGTDIGGDDAREDG